MTLLITGATGVLGSELASLLPEALHPSHQELDVRDADAVEGYIKTKVVDAVIHCAALTSVRFCQSNEGEAMMTNVYGTRNLVQALKKTRETFLCYVSTACVFPGDDPSKFYSEDDEPRPCNTYGRTKFLGECEALALRQALIVRTNFVQRGKWKYAKAFTDRFSNYLYADQVAKAIAELHQKRETGIRHVYGDKRNSMFELARLSDSTVEPMTMRDYEGPPLTVNMCLTSKVLPPIHLE